MQNADQVKRISFVKCDVKDFYMSGSTSEMTSNAFRHCSPEVKSAASAVLEHILLTQVVKCDQTGATYAVCKGSGMGSVVSGDVSDLDFYWLVEYDLDEPLLKSNGILLYARYRDDILCICLTRMLVRSMSFINQLVRRASPVYVLEVEPLQHFSCNMLDVTTYQNNDKIA